MNASVCESPRSGSTAVVDGATALASIVPADCGPLVADQPHLVDGARLRRRRRCSSPARPRPSRGRTPLSRCRRSGMSPDTVRTSGAANTCSAVDGAGCRPQRDSDAERAEPDDQRRRGRQHDRAASDSRAGRQLRTGSLRRRPAPGRAAGAAARRPSPPTPTAIVSRTARTSSANACATVRRCGGERRSMSARSDSGIACSAYGVARAIRSGSFGSVMRAPDTCAVRGWRRASAT